jgi:hypothetical protein
MSARSRQSKQSSERDRCSNADTPLTKGMSSSSRSASLEGVELPTAATVEWEPGNANSKPSFVEWEVMQIVQQQVIRQLLQEWLQISYFKRQSSLTATLT